MTSKTQDKGCCTATVHEHCAQSDAAALHICRNQMAKSTAESVLQTQILTECGVMHIIEGMHDPCLCTCMKSAADEPYLSSFFKAAR
ncbi:MAG TPA: hypothetical protein IAC19_00030 [Candidatus Ventricola gallistercoris]|nr:hypothetical protein [Candidatus Ventricola gallistercoris]